MLRMGTSKTSKMKTTVLSLSLTLCLTSSVNAQSFDAVSYHVDADSVTHNLIDFIQSPSDSGFIIIGNASQQVSPFENWSHYMKIDRIGNVLWSKQIGGGLENSVKSIETSTNGFLINGFFPGGSGISSLIEIDDNGNVLWSKNYVDPDGQRLFDKLVNVSGGVLNIGRSASQSIGCMKIDNSGNILWQKDYSLSLVTSVQEEIGFAISTEDGGALIGVNVIESNGAPLTWGVVLLKVTSDGTLSWSETLNSGAIDQVRCAYEETNGDFIVGGTSQDGSGTYDATLYRLTSSGNMISSNTIGADNGSVRFISNDGTFYEITTSKNHLIVLDGSLNVVNAKAIGDFENLQKSIQTFDGKIASGQRLLFSSSPVYLRDYAVTISTGALDQICLDSTITASTSNLTATATSFSSAITTTSITESSTTITPTSIATASSFLCSPSSIFDLAETKSQNFRVYPNPNTGNLSLELLGIHSNQSYQIHNGLGQLVSSGRLIDDRAQIDVSSLPDGVYQLRVLENGTELIGVERVVLIKN